MEMIQYPFHLNLQMAFTLVESIPVSWNHGTIQFSKDTFVLNDSIQIRVIDSDLNLNPEMIDSIT